jgi:hypothetical protein
VTDQSGRYQEVDPRAFDPSWQVRVRVGLGSLAAQERKQGHQTCLTLAQSLVAAFGPQNPFIDAPKLAALIQAAVDEYKGLGAQRFFNTPPEAAAFMEKQAQHPAAARPKNP